MSIALNCERRKVVNIAEDPHFYDYAEPGPVVPVLSEKKVSHDRYFNRMRVALFVLGVLSLVALVCVAFTWNP